MVFYAPAKINIGLHVIGKRDDGYHNIETIFYPIPLYDRLMLEEATEFSLQLKGLAIDGKIEDNTLHRIYHLLQSEKPTQAYKITLTKNIPPGSGLGGPSSDAATLLNALNQLNKLNLNKKQLGRLALQTGSDCPFFLNPKPAFARGRGEILEEMPSFLEGQYLVVVAPPIHLSTAEAYRYIPCKPAPFALQNINQIPQSKWQEIIRNDFEKIVFERHPEIKAIQQALLETGAFYSALSGSGSSLYGLFKHQPSLHKLLRNYRHWTFKM